MAFAGQRGCAEVRMGWVAGALVLGLTWGAVAQQPQGIAAVAATAPAPMAEAATAPALTAEAMGSVVGHVYLADTGGPARLAEVGLQPVEVRSDDRPWAERNKDPGFRLYETSLDGSYRIPRVKPGTYYLVVKEPGYLSPFAQFSNAQLSHPTLEDQQKIDEYLPMVTVTPNNTATMDMHLTRGASLSGTVRFDDGSPDPQTDVEVLQKDDKGKWRKVPLATGGDTDDLGHFRITGLLEGDYVLKAGVSIDNLYVNSVLEQPTSFSNSYDYRLAFYSGDTARLKDAKPIHLENSQAMDSANVTIPVSKLHAVSGAIVEAKTGRAIDSGTVTLDYADGDGEELVSAKVGPDEPVFRMPFVPEGSYVIKATNAADVSREEISYPPGTFPPFYTKSTVLRKYGTAEQPLIVTGDVSGVNLAVSPVAKTQ